MSLLNPHDAAGCNVFHIKASILSEDPPVKRDKDGIPIDPDYEIDYRFVDTARIKRNPGQTGYNSTPRGIAAAGRDWDEDRGVVPVKRIGKT